MPVDLNRSQLRAMLHDELRAAIQSELAAALSHAAPAQMPTSTQPSSPMSSAQLAQHREAEEAVDEVVAQGQWGEEERRMFYQKLSVLNAQETEQALSKLALAINSGRMTVRSESGAEE
jgi:hypothetical protein